MAHSCDPRPWEGEESQGDSCICIKFEANLNTPRTLSQKGKKSGKLYLNFVRVCGFLCELHAFIQKLGIVEPTEEKPAREGEVGSSQSPGGD